MRKGGIFDLEQSSGDDWNSSEDEHRLNEQASVKPTLEPGFEEIYGQAFSTKTTLQFSNRELAHAAFLDLKKISEDFDLSDNHEHPSLKNFFEQWEKPKNSHEKIAIALALRNFA